MTKIHNTSPTVALEAVDEIGRQYDQSNNRHESVRKLTEWADEQPVETWND